MTTRKDLTDILNTVAGLLAKAESTEFEEEAKTFRAGAERLMRKYHIAEEGLIATEQIEILPEWRDVEFSSKNRGILQAYINMMWDIATHVGVRVAFESRYVESRAQRVVTAELCGYSGDIQVAEALFGAARIAFGEAMEPEVKPELGDQVNAYRLRSAGVERWRIAALLWGSSSTDGAAHGKVAKLYKAECAARGEDAAVSGRNINAKTYREAYTVSFQTRLSTRLREARDAADSIGGALVLKGRQERIDQAFYVRHPEMRPSTEIGRVEDECSACKHAKSKCRKHKSATWTKADEARWQRIHNSDAGQAGRSVGRRAAESVQLSRTARAQRLEDGGDPQAKRAVQEILRGDS